MAFRHGELISHIVSGGEGQGREDFRGKLSRGKKVFITDVNEHELNFGLSDSSKSGLDRQKSKLNGLYLSVQREHNKAFSGVRKFPLIFAFNHFEFNPTKEGHVLSWRIAAIPNEKLTAAERDKLNRILSENAESLKKRIGEVIEE